MKILVAHNGSYEAHVESNPNLSGQGRSADEAVGNLMRKHQHLAGPIEIVNASRGDVWAPPEPKYVIQCPYELVPENMKSYADIKKQLKTACLVDGNIYWLDEGHHTVVIYSIIGGKAIHLGDVRESRFYKEAVKAGILVDVIPFLPLNNCDRNTTQNKKEERALWLKVLQSVTVRV